MNWPFSRRQTPPSLVDSARTLAEYQCLSNRERIRARTRLMRKQMGMAPSPYLNSKVKP